MAGTFPGTANTQQHDINGQPMAGALLTVYQGGSSSALANVYQDIGLTLPTTNPLVADASGRIPMFFVNDGTFGLRLTDAFGVQANGGFFYPSVPSIGASSSGGGGTPVDPTTVFSTGMWTWKPDAITMTGWVRLNGRTIGNASSGGSELANASAQALFLYIWNTYPDAKCPVVGGRGANALADFNANKQITLLDMRGRGPIGLDDMGNAAAGRISSANMPGSTDTVTTAAGYGGEANHTLTLTETPTGISTTITPGGGFPNIALSSGTIGSIQVTSTATTNIAPSNSNGNWVGVASLSGTSTNTGGQAHNNMGLFVLGSHFWKL